MIARLKRLSDSMLYSIREVYKSEGLDIEPNWHLVFLFLKKYETRTMTEMAEAFQLSQPAIVKMINKMKERGYVDVVSDTADNRKRQLRLSKKSKKALPGFEKIWFGGQESIRKMLQKNEVFLDSLEMLEQDIRQQSFRERILQHRKTD